MATSTKKVRFNIDYTSTSPPAVVKGGVRFPTMDDDRCQLIVSRLHAELDVVSAFVLQFPNLCHIVFDESAAGHRSRQNVILYRDVLAHVKADVKLLDSQCSSCAIPMSSRACIQNLSIHLKNLLTDCPSRCIPPSGCVCDH